VLASPVKIPGLTVDVDFALANGSAKFDLNVLVVSQPRHGFAPPPDAPGAADRVSPLWGYSSDVFERATMECMARQYVSLLHAVSDDAKRSGTDLAVAEDGDALAVAYAASAHSREASIIELWEAQAARSSDALALRSADGDPTYRQLDVAANRLAHLLRRRGVAPGDVVGFCLPRGGASIVTMHGVLKTGAAYLPLDPRQPGRRLAWLATDTDIRVALTARDAIPRLADCVNVDRLCLDDLGGELALRPPRSPAPTATGDSLAYVMFTSGSTGPPKGVEIRHRGVVRLLFGVDYVRLGGVHPHPAARAALIRRLDVRDLGGAATRRHPHRPCRRVAGRGEPRARHRR
jgi:non-ribosomal peptide synthetase component F